MEARVTNATKYGLKSRTVLIEIGKNHIGIVKNRKSRIIMKDGNNILNIAEQIIKTVPHTKVSLISNAPVCSKTEKYLLDNGIEIIHNTP